MAKASGGRSTSSSGKGSSGGGSRGSTEQRQEASGKGAIRDEFLRKKDELVKLKFLDIFLIKDALGTNPKKSDMKPELRGMVKRLKEKNSKI